MTGGAGTQDGQHEKMPVFLSSSMATACMRRRRAVVRSLFATDVQLSIFYLVSVEDNPSPLAPPPLTNLIAEKGAFLLLLGADDRTAVRKEIVQARAQECKFFVLFDRGSRDDGQVATFLKEMGFTDQSMPTFAGFTLDDELASLVKKAFLGYAVSAMRGYKPANRHEALLVAEYYRGRGLYKDALKKTDEILRENPANFDASFMKGYLLEQHLERPVAAAEAFLECTRMEPDSVSACFNLAVAYSKFDRRKAIEAYDRAEGLIGDNRNDADLKLMLGKLHYFRAMTVVELGSAVGKERVPEDFVKGAEILFEMQDDAARYWLKEMTRRRPEVLQYCKRECVSCQSVEDIAFPEHLCEYTQRWVSRTVANPRAPSVVNPPNLSTAVTRCARRLRRTHKTLQWANRRVSE